jgi:hypothetical protein
VWSLALSIISTGCINVAPIDTDDRDAVIAKADEEKAKGNHNIMTYAQIQPATLRRLRSVLRLDTDVTRPTLVSQLHLKGVIAHCTEVLAGIINNEGWYERTPVDQRDIALGAMEFIDPLLEDRELATFRSVVKNGYKSSRKSSANDANSTIHAELRNYLLSANDRDTLTQDEIKQYIEQAVMIADRTFHAQTSGATPAALFNEYIVESNARISETAGRIKKAELVGQRDLDEKTYIKLERYFTDSVPHARRNKKYAYRVNGGLQSESVVTHEWTHAAVRALLFRAALVTGDPLRFCVEKNIPVPIALTAWRPYKTYLMGSALRMQAGADGAAVTYFKNPDMMFADNAAQKVVYGHYTLYLRTIVTQPERIIIAYDIYSTGYFGGNGPDVWDACDEDDVSGFADNVMARDIFVTYQAMNESGSNGKNSSSWRSLTGIMPSSYSVSSDVNEKMHYPGCAGVAQMWGWKTDNIDFNDRSYHAMLSDHGNRSNVICFQDFQIRSTGSGGFESTREAGHWGPHVYEGCGVVRDGKSHSFDTTNGKGTTNTTNLK